MPKRRSSFFQSQFERTGTAEELRVIHLDSDRRIIGLTHAKGDQETISMPIREILREACLIETRGLILAHNHPSGDPTPSNADKIATRRLAELALLLDIYLIDHLIFGGDRWVSFRGLGLL
jgi:DNA repair protein RadC